MRSPLPRAFAVGLLAFAAATGTAPAQDEEKEPAEEPGAKCTCAKRNACWHFLKSPVDPPNDPCSCRRCETESRHDGTHVPDGWNDLCFRTGELDCFLRRHAASWRITCSECLATEKCCDFANSARCPACGEGERKDPFRVDCHNKDARSAAAARLAVEQKLFERRRPVVCYTRRFHVVTDVSRLQVTTRTGSLRWAEAHEYAHIMIERAEKALREFEEAFRGRVILTRPMGIYLPQAETTGFRIRERYFRNKNSPMVYSSYAGTMESSISDGFCLNGLCVSLQQAGGDDVDLHQSMRHLMGNILVTCWIKQNGENKSMPRWVFEGVAHWLGRRHPELGTLVWYCAGEEGKLSGSAKNWMKELTDQAIKGPPFPPVEELMAKTSLGQLTPADHRRVWGYFEICMAEWREPWVDFLADLRREVDQRDAFVKHLGCTPEEFHQRWVERLQGRRKSIAPSPADERAPDAVARFDAQLSDPAAAVAAKVRALGTVSDPAVVRALVAFMGRYESDLVRETILAALRRVQDPECRRAIWQAGLQDESRTARALAARLCRSLRLAEARDSLRKTLQDPFWLARSEAALALATLRDHDSQARIRDLVEDSSPKVRIGAMDALVVLGDDANRLCVPPVARNLNHTDWQVRVAAAQTLRDVGDWQAIDPLIARMRVEAGRVSEDCVAALRSISGEDLGEKPDNWKKWWDRESGRVKERGGFDPRPKVPSKANERYARPPEEKPPAHSYGVELFSQRVGFVLDTSRSTNRKFDPDVNTQGLLHAKYEGATIFDICQAEAAASVAALDPRAHFNVIAFGSDVRKWERTMVPANESNRNSAQSFLRSYSAEGETNFHGALLAALDADDGGSVSPDFRDTPDTMVFLTDGTPTRGDITDPDTLLEWFTELARYARVRTHTIAFGRLEVDEDLLRKMAERTGGRFTQLFEEN